MMGLSYGGNASFVNIDGEWKCVGVLVPPRKKPGGFAGYLACWRDALWCFWKAGWRTTRVRYGPSRGQSIGEIGADAAVSSIFYSNMITMHTNFMTQHFPSILRS